MTGKQRPFAHLPRAVDEPAQVRALLDAVGADWEYIGRSEIGAVYSMHEYREMMRAALERPFEPRDQPITAAEIEKAVLGTDEVRPTLPPVVGPADPSRQHRFIRMYEPGVDTTEEFDTDVGGGEPARGYRVKRRPIREIAQEHGIPEPSKEIQQARVDWVTRKPMGNEVTAYTVCPSSRARISHRERCLS